MLPIFISKKSVRFRAVCIISYFHHAINRLINVNFRKPDYLLLFILAIGAALRFYGFPHIPFMYDEVSAWARTGYSSFSELINHGVKGDGHPAGIQVFLFFWRKVAGDSEAAFKLPFLLMGLCSIWLVFKIGSYWFNHSVGYISAAFIACLQYTVMYSQIARPYASGLFFALVMVWCWTQYLLNDQQKRRNWYLAGYVLFAALCCYNHYFSLLFAFITGLTGLFFLGKKNIKHYLVANVLVVLLFIPHLPITLFQFGIGGVGGWLPKPGVDFFRNYLDYIFHFSWWMKGLAIALILFGMVYPSSKLSSTFRFRVIALSWFLLPFFTGYFYSIFRNAVLQYSVLIFSFPYLIFFIFSWIKALPLRMNWLLVTAILAFGVCTLIFQRMHYDIFYHQPVEQLVKNTLHSMENMGDEKCTVLMNEPRKYAGYYLKKFKKQASMDYWPEKDFQSYIAFRKYLSAQNTDCVIAANLTPDYLLEIRQTYPYEIARDKGFTFQYHVFSKTDVKKQVPDDEVFWRSLNLQVPNGPWLADKNEAAENKDSTTAFHYTAAVEFGPAFKASLLPLITNGHNIVNITMKVKGIQPGNGASLVVSFDDNSGNRFWQEKPFSYFIDSTENAGTVFYSISIRDLGFPIAKDLTLSAYAWNKAHDDFYVTDFNVSIEEGNPWIYGLLEAIPRKHP